MGEISAKLPDGKEAKIAIKEMKIAIVQSRYNNSITNELFRGAREGLRDCNVSEEIFSIDVPGALEIPLAVKRLAESKQKKFDAIIALGCVIRGETSHYDLICNEITRALMNISLDYNIPVLHGILTTENIEQAKARSGEKMNNKGYECALSAVEFCLSLKSF